MKKIFKIYVILALSLVVMMGCKDDDDFVINKVDSLGNLTAESLIEAVRFQWDLPLGDVNSYVINYTSSVDNDDIILTDGSLTEYTLEGLESDIAHTFNVIWIDENFNPSEMATVIATPLVRPPGTYLGNLVIGSQSELNNFSLSGDASLNIIEGDLIIQSDGSDNIFDLSIFDNLNLIRGSLIIRDNPILSNLDYLTALTVIEGGVLTIENNRNLVNLCGLGNLTGSISESINNNGFNPSLADVIAENCKTNDLIYEEYPRFDTQAAIDALPDGITHFPGELVIGLEPGNDITDLSKFSKLRRIEGRLIIQRSPQLTDLTGFRSLEFVGNTTSDELVIRQMDGLTTLDGLQALRHIGRRIGIRENPVLQTLDGLDNLQTIGENRILIGVCDSPVHGNPSLTDYCALQGIIGIIGIEQLELASSCLDSFSNFNPSFQDVLDGNCSN